MPALLQTLRTLFTRAIQFCRTLVLVCSRSLPTLPSLHAVSAPIQTPPLEGIELPEEYSLASWLETWLTHKAGEVRVSTLEGYRQVVANHLLPVLGGERLDALQPRHVDALHKTLQAKGLSHRMVEYAHVLLHGALDYAVRLERLPRNVAALVKLPRKLEGNERLFWSAEEGTRFLAHLERTNHRLQAFFYVALTTGCAGESCAAYAGWT